MEVLIIVLLIAILLVNMLIVVILKKPEVIMEDGEPRGIMTPNGKILFETEKWSPVYNDDETVWLREQDNH